MPFGFGFNYNLNDVFQGLFAKTIMDFRFGNTGNGFWGCNYTNMNSCWGNGFAQMGWGDTFAAGSAGGSSSSTVEGEEERLKEQEEKNKIKNKKLVQYVKFFYGSEMQCKDSALVVLSYQRILEGNGRGGGSQFQHLTLQV